MRRRGFFAVGLVACLLIAGVASFYASASPDGLEKVAAEKGFESTASTHALADWPFAEYVTRGVGDARLSGGLAGITGVALTLLLAGGMFSLLGRRRSRGDGEPADGDHLDAGTAGDPAPVIPQPGTSG